MLMDNSGSTTPPLSGKDCPEGPFEIDLEKLSEMSRSLLNLRTE
jgi:hypothetical protein